MVEPYLKKPHFSGDYLEQRMKNAAVGSLVLWVKGVVRYVAMTTSVQCLPLDYHFIVRDNIWKIITKSCNNYIINTKHWISNFWYSDWLSTLGIHPTSCSLSKFGNRPRNSAFETVNNNMQSRCLHGLTFETST